ncbi:MAG: hypothetical protein AVDCRST_MAG52-3289, partial [uncultured Blastococcus sp.]
AGPVVGPRGRRGLHRRAREALGGRAAGGTARGRHPGRREGTACSGPRRGSGTRPADDGPGRPCPGPAAAEARRGVRVPTRRTRLRDSRPDPGHAGTAQHRRVLGRQERLRETEVPHRPRAGPTARGLRRRGRRPEPGRQSRVLSGQRVRLPVAGLHGHHDRAEHGPVRGPLLLPERVDRDRQCHVRRQHIGAHGPVREFRLRHDHHARAVELQRMGLGFRGARVQSDTARHRSSDRLVRNRPELQRDEDDDRLSLGQAGPVVLDQAGELHRSARKSLRAQPRRHSRGQRRRHLRQRRQPGQRDPVDPVVHDEPAAGLERGAAVGLDHAQLLPRLRQLAARL